MPEVPVFLSELSVDKLREILGQLSQGADEAVGSTLFGAVSGKLANLRGKNFPRAVLLKEIELELLGKFVDRATLEKITDRSGKVVSPQIVYDYEHV